MKLILKCPNNQGFDTEIALKCQIFHEIEISQFEKREINSETKYCKPNAMKGINYL